MIDMRCLFGKIEVYKFTDGTFTFFANQKTTIWNEINLEYIGFFVSKLK